jgi:hypothetical protein
MITEGTMLWVSEVALYSYVTPPGCYKGAYKKVMDYSGPVNVVVVEPLMNEEDRGKLVSHDYERVVSVEICVITKVDSNDYHDNTFIMIVDDEDKSVKRMNG